MQKSIWLSLASAVGATACCTTPLILGLAGATSISALSFLEPIYPFTAALSLGLLGFSYYRAFRKPRRGEADCCATDGKKTNWLERHQKGLLLGFTPVILLLLAWPYLPWGLMNQHPQQLPTQAVVSTWRVEGMDCQACAAGLEASLREVPGMLDCRVDYGRQEMECVLRPGELSPDRIPALTRERGLKAEPVNRKKGV